MITAWTSGESDKLPKSFMKIIKFYRIFGFSFIEPNTDKNKKFFSKIKDYFLIIFNILSIIYVIIDEYLGSPESSQMFDNLSSKTLMRGLYYVGVCLRCVDLISAFILSLLRSKKLIILLKTEDVLIIDTNTKRANMLIISKIIIMSIIAIICSYLWIDLSWYRNTTGFNRLIYFIFGFYSMLMIAIGLFVLPVIYCYIIWIITSQINNLKNNISRGNTILYLSKSSVFTRIKNQIISIKESSK